LADAERLAVDLVHALAARILDPVVVADGNELLPHLVVLGGAANAKLAAVFATLLTSVSEHSKTILRARMLTPCSACRASCQARAAGGRRLSRASGRSLARSRSAPSRAGPVIRRRAKDPRFWRALRSPNTRAPCAARRHCHWLHADGALR